MPNKTTTEPLQTTAERTAYRKQFICENCGKISAKAIAQILGMAVSSVRTIIRRAGLSTRQRGWTVKQQRLLEANVDKPTKELVKLLGVSGETIRAKRKLLRALPPNLTLARPIGKPAPGWRPR